MGKVLVVGSLHYDIMLNANHLPEKGETVLSSKTAFKFGGKGGNQAVSCAQQGSTVRFVGAVGDDEHGLYLLKTLQSSGIETNTLSVLKGVASGMSVAISEEDGDYGAVVASNANQHIDLNVFDSTSLWDGVSMLILQNEISPLANLKAAQEAKKRGVTVCMNAAPVTDQYCHVFEFVDVLVVNAIEARDMTGIDVIDVYSAKEAAYALIKRFNQVVITLGGKGVVFAEVDNGMGIVDAEPVQLISTHGAGDCFMGALCAKLNVNETLIDAVCFANHQAAVHVSSHK